MMVVRIQTTEHSNPPAAMVKAIEQLSAEVGHLKQQLHAAAPRDENMTQQPQLQQQQGYGGYPDPQGGYSYGAPPAAGYGGYQQGGGGYGFGA
jgi:hypothetical protein